MKRLVCAIVLAALTGSAVRAQAQSSPSTQPVPVAAAKMEFDVASVRQNKSNDRPTTNFPIQTGLTGAYDFVLEFTPEIPAGANPGSFQPDAFGPPFLETLTEQLGLKLHSQQSPADVWIVDHIEHPSEN
jgi:Protein of unknown function (DUF3738)